MIKEIKRIFDKVFDKNLAFYKRFSSFLDGIPEEVDSKIKKNEDYLRIKKGDSVYNFLRMLDTFIISKESNEDSFGVGDQILYLKLKINEIENLPITYSLPILKFEEAIMSIKSNNGKDNRYIYEKNEVEIERTTKDKYTFILYTIMSDDTRVIEYSRAVSVSDKNTDETKNLD